MRIIIEPKAAGNAAGLVYKEVETMKIDSFNVNTSAQRTAASMDHTKQVLTTLAPVGNLAGQNAPEDDGVQLNLSGDADKMQQQSKEAIMEQLDQARAERAGSRTGIASFLEDQNTLRINLLEEMVYALTGRRVKFNNPAVNMGGGKSAVRAQRSLSHMAAFASGQGQAGQANMRNPAFRMETEHYHFESESVSYQAQGQVKTADGKTINVDVQLNMDRAYSSYTKTSVDVEFKNTVDPLVVNYSGTAASLTERKFEFDLDFDGRMDNISFAGEGSGFLALDKNGDGKINDGRELFGPSTGAGFDELENFDDDGNGWIDENDAVWNSLKVWSKDAEGNDVFYTLKDVNVGAIYLGETETEFSVKEAATNDTQGVVRSTSFFLKEDGSGAGTVQHIDLTL